MVVLLILVRMQRGAPMVAELTVLAQFIVFLSLPDAEAASGGSPPLMKELLDAADFLSRARRRLRFRSLIAGTAHAVAVRVERRLVECDWLMRPADPWDKDLPAHLARENQTLQALRDALTLREVVFKSFPAVVNATLRMFRADSDHRLELVMTGNVNRSNEAFERVASVAMRARLCGFHFNLEEGASGKSDPGSAELFLSPMQSLHSGIGRAVLEFVKQGAVLLVDQFGRCV